MFKALTRLVLGPGTLPDTVRATLERDRIDLLAEGLHGSITFRNYRAPGRYSNWRRTWFVGALALTPRRMVAYYRRHALLDLAYDHPAARSVEVALENDARLLISYDASMFHADRSGRIELRFSTPDASAIYGRIRQHLR